MQSSAKKHLSPENEERVSRRNSDTYLEPEFLTKVLGPVPDEGQADSPLLKNLQKGSERESSPKKPIPIIWEEDFMQETSKESSKGKSPLLQSQLSNFGQKSKFSDPRTVESRPSPSPVKRQLIAPANLELCHPKMSYGESPGPGDRTPNNFSVSIQIGSNPMQCDACSPQISPNQSPSKDHRDNGFTTTQKLLGHFDKIENNQIYPANQNQSNNNNFGRSPQDPITGRPEPPQHKASFEKSPGILRKSEFYFDGLEVSKIPDPPKTITIQRPEPLIIDATMTKTIPKPQNSKFPDI
jgi:hypothetical protein